MSEVDVCTEITISGPRHEVAAFAADPDRAPEWYVNIKSVEWRSPRTLQTGALLAFVAHFLGRRLAYVYRVEEYRPGERMVMRTVDGPFPMQTIYEWEDQPGGGTRMRLRNRGTPRGFALWLAPFMAIAMRRANRKDLARLKALLETPNSGA